MRLFFFMAFLFAACASLDAKVGCMDNSYHLSEPFDNKDYHYVECNCPCKTQLDERNMCVECRHYHEPKPWVVVDGVVLAWLDNAKELVVSPEAVRVLEVFVTRHKNVHTVNQVEAQ